MPKFLLIFFCVLLFSGCDSQPVPVQQKASAVKEKPATEPARAARSLLRQPVEAALVETAAEALPLWRSQAGQDTPLVLLSSNPFLQPLPEALRDKVVELLNQAPASQLLAGSAPFTPAPLMGPNMAVGAALEAGFFSKLYWLLPTAQDNDQNEQAVLSLEVFRQQLLDSQLISPAEAETIQLDNGRFSGTLRGIPFVACRLTEIPPLPQSAIFHVDLSYFRSIYKGEIKTPLYPLVQFTLASLRDAGISTRGTTVSSSNIDGSLPLQTRFLGPDIVTLLSRPELLDSMDEPLWEQRANALYLENFFQKERVRDIYLAMEKIAPEDPDVQYNLYQRARQFKQGDLAFRHLATAVSIDGVYAREYLDLAPLALEKNRPDEALRMLNMAAAAMPDNPFIKLALVELSLRAGQEAQAQALLPGLKRLSWSPTYYPDMPGYLERLEKGDPSSTLPQPPREAYGRKQR